MNLLNSDSRLFASEFSYKDTLIGTGSYKNKNISITQEYPITQFINTHLWEGDEHRTGTFSS